MLISLKCGCFADIPQMHAARDSISEHPTQICIPLTRIMVNYDISLIRAQNRDAGSSADRWVVY